MAANPPHNPLLSNQGNELLVHNNHIYQRHSEYNGVNVHTEYFRCVKRPYPNQCLALLRRRGVQIIVGATPHNHPPNPTNISVRRVLNRMNAEAAAAMEQPLNVVARNIQALPLVVQVALPPVHLMRQRVRRARARAIDAPPNPINLNNVIIPLAQGLLENGMPFLRIDRSITLNERFILFATNEQLAFLRQSDMWLGDGTFHAAPNHLFGQLYTIHAMIGANVVVCVYVLMSRRTENLYRAMFQALRQLVPQAQPQFYVSDFEIAAINAVQQTFPGIVCRGCFFHFQQSLWRKVQSLPIMLHRYNNEVHFSTHVRMISALAFLPSNHVVPAYNFMRQMPFYVNNANDFGLFWHYFERTWLGELDINGQRGQPLFAIPLWNCNSAALNLQPRTNNHVEGYHRGFYARFFKQSLSLWTMMRNFKLDAAIATATINDILAGNPPQQGRPAYARLARRIQAAAQNFNNMPGLPYDYFLRTFAHLVANP